MKLKSSMNGATPFFLRRMTAWCAKQIGLPVGKVQLAVFRNSRSSWGGCARSWRGQITVCVAGANAFPASCSTHAQGEIFQDRIECLVAVTAHELYHLYAAFNGERTRGNGRRYQSSERTTCLHEMLVLRAFRLEREALLAKWSAEPERAAVVPLTERRAAKAQKDLARWQRRLKFAQNKVRKLNRRVAYYVSATP